jgi:hypothetical protein
VLEQQIADFVPKLQIWDIFPDQFPLTPYIGATRMPGLLIALLLFILGGGVFLVLKKRWRGLGLATGMFLSVIGIGLWAIFQSRSSTAAIGILFLPFYALFAAVMAWLFGNLRGAARPLLRLLGWICLLLSLATPAWLVTQGFQSIALNASRDEQHRAAVAAIDRNRLAIRAALGQAPGHEAEILAGLIREHADDRTYLLPILESTFVSADALDHFAAHDDLGIALSAVRNPNCRATTLARIYRTHSYPDYFFQALASHPNTPPDILSELFRRPPTIMGLDRSFAANPATPHEIIQEIIATTKESFVVQRLLHNPTLDCAQLRDIETALKRTERPEDSFSIRRITELHAEKCAAKP